MFFFACFYDVIDDFFHILGVESHQSLSRPRSPSPITDVRTFHQNVLAALPGKIPGSITTTSTQKTVLDNSVSQPVGRQAFLNLLKIRIPNINFIKMMKRVKLLKHSVTTN